MNIQTARQNFFKENPNSLAYFCKNEKLDKYLCFTFDYGISCQSEISDQEILQLQEYGNGKNEEPIISIINYYSTFGIKQSLLEKLSDFYYQTAVNGITHKTIKEACEEFNKFCEKNSKKTPSSTKSYVACYEVLPDGNLDKNRIFYMELLFTKDKNGSKVCKIENTFTDDNFRNNGIHSMGIKFLEAVLSKKYIHCLIGESQECDVYEEDGASTLENHYKNLGFRVITDKAGTNHIIKEIDSSNSMQICQSDFDCYRE